MFKKIGCLKCGKKKWRWGSKMKLGELTYPVFNYYCSNGCEAEFKETLHLIIGYSDGAEEAFEIANKEMELNLKYV